ncbi:unnamed protein product [Parnassius apollo]|uniref:(apollo) hypothetical protein n=1 Tax=Parnassius apollo TaxID=110799 RepID=A0A8S3XYV7_PARAO|nr:unnamed protein product [Parnassius apollo]
MHLSSVRVALAAVLALVLGLAVASPSPPHHVARRSFFKLQCKGIYDASIFARLDRICDDCYNLFRDPSLYNLCRKDCFTTDYFKGCVEGFRQECFQSKHFMGCVEALLLLDEKEEIEQMVDYLGKR